MQHRLVEIFQQNLHLGHHTVRPAQGHAERFLAAEHIGRLDEHIQRLLVLSGVRIEVAQRQGGRIVRRPLLLLQRSTFALN